LLANLDNSCFLTSLALLLGIAAEILRRRLEWKARPKGERQRSFKGGLTNTSNWQIVPLQSEKKTADINFIANGYRLPVFSTGIRQQGMQAEL
jgi:hypothetical protein